MPSVPLAKYSMTTETLPYPVSLLRLANSSPVVHIRTVSEQLTDGGHQLRPGLDLTDPKSRTQCKDVSGASALLPHHMPESGRSLSSYS